METKICNNPICKADNPIEAKFCRKCGTPFSQNIKSSTSSSSPMSDDNRPFHLRHPELHLKPISEFRFTFVFNSPEYVEDPNMAANPDYLYIARKGKVGILHSETIKHWFGDEHPYKRIIPCKYDSIEKADGYFVCRNESGVTYFDLKGNELR